ncbi:MAG: hypothetical protein AB1649_01500 [Chloroflexota bacterium]
MNNRCFDDKDQCWRVNLFDGRGWVKEGEGSQNYHEAKQAPTPYQSLRARLAELKKRLHAQFAEQEAAEKVAEVSDREARTAHNNRRYLL